MDDRRGSEQARCPLVTVQVDGSSSAASLPPMPRLRPRPGAACLRKCP